ncbi:RTA1 like protein [Colletotrichum tofieldiae]|nr:RTA1 like protein [Colletotrichum tofieldiae]
MILGRIILLTEGEVHSIIRRKWLTKLFVFGDVVSFIMQGAGGGIMASGTLEALEKGEHIVIGGLVVQIIFFSLFAITAAIFHRRLSRFPTRKVLQAVIPWETYLNVLYAASALILVRSVFRLIEYAQGNDGYLISHEVFLYVFDAVLMFATMCVFAWKHPSSINTFLKEDRGSSDSTLNYNMA